MTQKNAIAAYVLTVLVFLLGVKTLWNNFEPIFNEAEQRMGRETPNMMALTQNTDLRTLKELLYRGGYFEDEKDALFVASTISERMKKKGQLPNLGALMKPDFKVKADTMVGGAGFKDRVKYDRAIIGLTDLDVVVDSVKNTQRRDSLAAVKGNVFEVGDKASQGVITVKINRNKKGENPDSLAGIAVRITCYPDLSEVPDSGVVEMPESVVMGYAKTDAKGEAIFKVPQGSRYSVLPMLEGWQFGRERGTVGGDLGDELEVSFIPKEHTLSILSPQVFSNIKRDRALIARTPAQFKSALIKTVTTYIFGWLLMLLFVFMLDRRSKSQSDYLTLIALMIITGISLLASYGIWNPLIDTLYASVMTSGLWMGLAGMAVAIWFNYAKLDARLSASKYWVLRNYGWTVLAGAVALLFMLYFFGTGPEGSDAKVNLFGFQPSDIARIMIVVFMAWFFAHKATLIQDFSAQTTKLTMRRHVMVMIWIIVGMLFLMGLYLRLSDMGPALIVLTTFILLYSMARRDFFQLLIGVLSFAVMMIAARYLAHSVIQLNNSLPLLIPTAIVWFAVWIVYWYKKRKQIYESAIFMNLVITVFSVAGGILQAIGMESLAKRLSNRSNMAWEGVWDNMVTGGDQVVQGIWSLATGGVTGLGLGNGSPSLVPAGHTDMIFTTIGEMLGFVGLVLVVLCFVVLIHRALLDGRRAGSSFPFFLATGIAIVTGVQFLAIVAGSLGLLPLTGVTLPFLSYGRVSFALSMVSFGFVISVSRLRGTEAQRVRANTYNKSVKACTMLFILVGLVVLGTSFGYQTFSRGKTLIRPAFVTNTNGARIVEYNPRIGLVLRKLEAGNIYDRNGLLLATSSPDSLLVVPDKKKSDTYAALEKAGVTKKMIEAQTGKQRRRYYPFGDHTLFMLGDFNTLKVFGYTDNSPIGYLAEARHLEALRGLDIPDGELYTPNNGDSIVVRSNRFSKPKQLPSPVLRTRDYSELLRGGFLDDGIERNKAIEKHNANREQRDITLTIDAKLQMALQNAIADFIAKDPSFKNNKNIRSSVVVLDALKGDLLSSANYPLPDQQKIYEINIAGLNVDAPSELDRSQPAVTERDLGLTFQTFPGSTAKIMSAMAGFRKLGMDASKQTFDINDIEKVDKALGEPGGPHVGMRQSIVESSNCYFIHLVNKNDLYEPLADIYTNVGVRLDVNPGDFGFGGGYIPYFLYPSEFISQSNYYSLMNRVGAKAMQKYNNYMEKRGPGNYEVMNWKETGLAWGQSPIYASPANMARVASIVANKGMLVPTRYLLKNGDEVTKPENGIEIISEKTADELKEYMQAQSNDIKSLPHVGNIGGKTGTPERAWPMRTWKNKHHEEKSNDAWYIFFIDVEKKSINNKNKEIAENGTLAVAVRIERTGTGKGSTSAKAVQLVSRVIAVLSECKYEPKK